MRRTLFLLLSTLALVGNASTGAAADTGQAYDLVMKMLYGQPLEPGDFAADWQAAVTPPSAQTGARGGLPPWYFTSGSAESRYIAGSKERIDKIVEGRATIYDCAARTATYLDLRAKTFFVVSMDQQPAPPRVGTSRPQPEPAVRATGNSTIGASLGQVTVFGKIAYGYVSRISSAQTMPDGSTIRTTMVSKAYLSGIPELRPDCPGEVARQSTGPQPAFTVAGAPTSSLAYFEGVEYSNDGSRGTAFAIERNNIRSIDSSDPLFSVPAGFTSVEPPARFSSGRAPG